MKKEELLRAFKNVVIKNELYDDEAVVIPKVLENKFIDAFYTELIFSDECKSRKRYYFNYTKKVMREKGWYINEMTVLEFINEHIHDESDFEDIKVALSSSKNWSMFWKYVNEVFGILEIV